MLSLLVTSAGFCNNKELFKTILKVTIGGVFTSWWVITNILLQKLFIFLPHHSKVRYKLLITFGIIHQHQSIWHTQQD